MANISVSLPSDGTTADVSDYNTPITTIVNEFNGNIDNSNIKSGAAIATAKLADDAGVTTAKIADSAITSAKVATGVPVQIVNTTSTAVATGTTTTPLDDTIPQITEGTEFMTLSITPKSATNILVIQVIAMASFSAAAGTFITALHQDSTANALAADAQVTTGSGFTYSLTLTHTMTAGTTSATTFRVRIGNSAAGTVTFNGSAGGRYFGAIPKSSIVITEYKA